jgi:hypothetical protein
MMAALATRLSLPREVVDDLAAARRMAHVNCFLEIELGRHRSKVVSIVIHVVAVADLRRAPVTAPVMGDDAIAVIKKEQQLRVPVIGRQRPAMAENDGLTRAPVLVEDLNAVFCRDCIHRTNSVGSG